MTSFFQVCLQCFDAPSSLVPVKSIWFTFLVLAYPGCHYMIAVVVVVPFLRSKSVVEKKDKVH